MTVAITDIVRQLRDLPSLSAVVVELLSSMEDDDVDAHMLGDKIAMDQSLTAKTLRLANSSFYGMSSKVTSIHQAIAVLGVHSIRTLVTACAVTDSFPAGASTHFNFKSFWRHSVGTAVCAKLLAPHLKLNPETAFTAGLLHDIGTLVLATRLPAEYAQMLAYRREHDCYVVEAEQAVFGTDHAAVGSALAAHWKFPEAMQSAVADHHTWDATGQPPSLALLVHAANIIAHALDLSDDPDDLVPPLAQGVWNALDLSDAAWQRLLRETESAHADMCQILVN
jgi:putative nucleotidyltransferase with HDIG domain